ncbi:hypothetical protein CTAYLR_004864 [Chrysophaeum taylorii]|uniref:Uncharacterized protein n=1 Tax=Chrysophaeum taylorii TaxID=2483200 RepID=A0AAD7UED2_9STRA|nr:hypothetical protein CTAYLR_004864 [Chrysophaeum taylorii]
MIRLLVAIASSSSSSALVVPPNNNAARAKDLGFWDEARLEVHGGDGGDGCLAFRREWGTPLGGPSGGNGGQGGSVVLVCDSRLNTLGVARRKSKYQAAKGANGQGSKKHASRSEDVEVRVPPGTIVREWETQRVAGEIVKDGERLVVARGGRGGRGNAAFKSDRLVAPKLAERGERGARRVVRLELRLAADVGLVGLPNAGKSTLLAAATAARPKIAAYAFTTVVPNLGVWEPESYARSRQSPTGRGALATRARRSSIGGLTKKGRRRQSRQRSGSESEDAYARSQIALALGEQRPEEQEVTSADDRGLVLADVPGLIENAHLGAGMGDAFLRHVERCRVLLHVVDATSEDPIADLRTIDAELGSYSESLATKPRVVALNKCDAIDRKDAARLVRDVRAEVGHERVAAVSATTRKGVDHLMRKLRRFCDAEKTRPRLATVEVDFDPPFANSRDNPDRSWDLLDGRDHGAPGSWRIVSPRIEKIASMTNFDQPDAIARFARQLDALGVSEALKTRGAMPRDVVMIGDDIDLAYDPLGWDQHRRFSSRG